MTRPVPTLLASALVALGAPALAEAPRVLADVAPVHSLVAIVMEGAAGPAPAMIVAAGQSPHDSSLRPSEAQALAEADLVVWTGEALVPWVGEAVESLAPDARVVALLDAPGWEPLAARAAHAHEEGGHAEEAGHEGEDADHEEGHEETGSPEHDHDHAGGLDPHAWLDPAVAAAWLSPIAEALAAEDPANAALYRANASAAAPRLMALGRDARARLEPLGGGLIVGHDAYQYFERAAGLPAARAVAPADGAQPSPGDLAALRDAVAAGEAACLLTDSESDPSWAATLGEGTALRTASVDPEGLLLPPGPVLYPALIEGMVAAVEGCLG